MKILCYNYDKAFFLILWYFFLNSDILFFHPLRDFCNGCYHSVALFCFLFFRKTLISFNSFLYPFFTFVIIFMWWIFKPIWNIYMKKVLSKKFITKIYKKNWIYWKTYALLNFNFVVILKITWITFKILFSNAFSRNDRVIPCQIIQHFCMLTPLPLTFCSFFSLFVDNVEMINPWKFQTSTLYKSKVIEIWNFDQNGCSRLKSAILNLCFQ